MSSTQLYIIHNAISQLQRLKETYEDDKRVIPYHPEVQELADYYEDKAKRLAESLSSLHEKIEEHGLENEHLWSERLEDVIYGLYIDSMHQHHLSKVLREYMVRKMKKAGA